MDVIAGYARERRQPKLPMRWPDYLAWASYMLALVQAGLNLTVDDLTSPSALAIYHLYTPGAIGAVILLLYTAWCHPPGAGPGFCWPAHLPCRLYGSRSLWSDGAPAC